MFQFAYSRVKLVVLLVLVLLALMALGACQNNTEVEATVAALSTGVAAAQSTAENAANTAAAVATKAAVAAPGDAQVTLKGAIGLTYQDEGTEKSIFFPVDRVIIYPLLDDFFSAWTGNESAEVKLAWQPTTLPDDQTPSTGQLFYADDLLSSDQPPTFVGWSEFLLSAHIALPGTTAAESATLAGRLIVDQGPAQTVMTAIPFVAATTIDESLSNFMDSGGNVEAVERLLVLDRSGNGGEIVMIVFFSDVDDPSDEDRLRREQCARCYAGLCRITCWLYRYPRR